MSNLYNSLTQYGSQCELDITTNASQIVHFTEDNFNYVRYNPRKDINRWGLSVTSLDGKLTGIPDLDSLYEYNKENGTTYSELDFSVKTEVYNRSPEIQQVLEPWKDNIFRTHILKFGPGGFFPPHRDMPHMRLYPEEFRLIMPLRNCNPPYFNFVLEDKILHWDIGRLYFLDTLKTHYLFNSGFNDSYWLVVNVLLNEDTVKETLMRLNQK